MHTRNRDVARIWLDWSGMCPQFVAIADPLHELLRALNREAHLHYWLEQDARISIRHRVQIANWPEAYFKIALLHTLGGIPLDVIPDNAQGPESRHRLEIAQRAGFLDLIKLDRRCCRDLRRLQRGNAPLLACAEILCYGIGTLRARNDDLQDPAEAHLMQYYGRVTSVLEEVDSQILALHSRTNHPEDVGKERYDSTNVIYGDVYGELEQLWDRRSETSFLDRVADALQSFPRKSAADCWRAPKAVPTLVALHQKNRLWKAPPTGARSLLRRLDFILENTVVDRSAVTMKLFSSAPTYPEWLPDPEALEDQGSDDSGYDGWLQSGSGEI
jgi:hypothetical protein